MRKTSGCVLFIYLAYFNYIAMTKKSPIALAALLLALGTSAVTLLPVVAQAQTAEKKEAPKEVIRTEWTKPWQEIQALITDKKFPEALEKINALSKFENKTPYESFFLSRTKAVIASSTNNTELLATCFEEMINGEFLTAAEKLKYTEAMAGTYYNAKKYKEAQVWTKRYLALEPNNVVMQDLEVQNYYLTDDFINAAKAVKVQIAADEAAKRVPGETRLRLLHGASMKMKDIEGSTKALELLVKYHPTKEYWADLLYRLPNKPGFNDRLRLDWYRLLLATDTMEDGSQFMEMAETALLSGLPLEAKHIMEAGYKANLLGTGKMVAKHKPLLDKATKQAADDAKTLDAGEASAKAAKTGLGMVNMGYNLVINGQHERGISLIEQGIAKGGLKSPEEAKLHLGMSYLQAGNKEKAFEVLKTVQGTDGAVELAHYWMLMK